MPRMVIELEWDDKLGITWMNIHNLELLLYGTTCVTKELLSATDITHKVELARQRSKIIEDLVQYQHKD